MKKVARSGALSLLRRCSSCESLLSRNCNSTSAAWSGSLYASDSVAASDSSSTLISLRAPAKQFFKATPPPPPFPPPFSSSLSSFPAADCAVANGSVNFFGGGTINPGKPQNSKSVFLQRLVERSLSSSASSESPPPPPLPRPYHRQNPPDATNPDPVTLQEQWRYATRMYSMWYAHAWGTAILAGLSFYGLGWFIKGENPLQFGSSDKKEDVPLKPE